MTQLNEQELKKALTVRDGWVDKMLALREYMPQTLKWRALNEFLRNGHQEVGMPKNLRSAQGKVLELLGKET